MNRHRYLQQEIFSRRTVLRDGKYSQGIVRKHVFTSTILMLLSLSIVGCGIHNIRPESDTPNFQKTLTVMTLNIRHGCGWEKFGLASSAFFKGCTKNYDKIIAAIRSADPDVVGLQEVSSGQAGKIAKALNMNYVYTSHNLSGYGNWWGNAVLSKFKILDSKKKEIGGSAGRNRSMVSAIGLVNDKPVAFVSIHTDHRLYDEISVVRILRYVNSISMPTILIGDFNMDPISPRASLITEGAGFIDSAADSEKIGRKLGTYGSPQAERLDYVFVQSRYFQVLEGNLVAEEHHRASDHLAYYAKIEWK